MYLSAYLTWYQSVNQSEPHTQSSVDKTFGNNKKSKQPPKIQLNYYTEIDSSQTPQLTRRYIIFHLRSFVNSLTLSLTNS